MGRIIRTRGGFIFPKREAHDDGAFGKTAGGRLLTIFFVRKKQGVLIISARNMTNKEKRFYDKK